MKKLLLIALVAAPVTALAQDSLGFPNPYLYPTPIPAPVYGLPVQPVLPVPNDRGPWGTGYSIVTTTKPKTNIFNRDLTGSETVQRIVPNDALGQPIKGLDLPW